MSLKEKTKLQKTNQENNTGEIPGNNTKDNQDDGYVQKLLTEQDVYTSGVIYRYINNVDPNKDLITDTAKYGGPLKIETVPDYPK